MNLRHFLASNLGFVQFVRAVLLAVDVVVILQDSIAY